MSESLNMQKWISSIVSASQCVKTQERSQWEISNGKFFVACRTTDAIANSSYIGIQMNTPSSTIATIHARMRFCNSGGLGKIYVFEISTDSTYATGTTAITAYNRNRQSTNTASAGCYYIPVAEACLSSTISSSQGYLLDTYFINSTGTNANHLGGDFRSANDYILKGNTTYVFYLLNNSGNSGYGSFKMLWYESTN
jgi:hypothetical protein